MWIVPIRLFARAPFFVSLRLIYCIFIFALCSSTSSYASGSTNARSIIPPDSPIPSIDGFYTSNDSDNDASRFGLHGDGVADLLRDFPAIGIDPLVTSPLNPTNLVSSAGFTTTIVRTSPRPLTTLFGLSSVSSDVQPSTAFSETATPIVITSTHALSSSSSSHVHTTPQSTNFETATTTAVVSPPISPSIPLSSVQTMPQRTTAPTSAVVTSITAVLSVHSVIPSIITSTRTRTRSHKPVGTYLPQSSESLESSSSILSGSSSSFASSSGSVSGLTSIVSQTSVVVTSVSSSPSSLSLFTSSDSMTISSGTTGTIVSSHSIPASALSMPTNTSPSPSSTATSTTTDMPSSASLTTLTMHTSMPSSSSSMSLTPVTTLLMNPTPFPSSSTSTPTPTASSRPQTKLSGTIIAVITMLSFLSLLSLGLGAFVYARTRRKRIAGIQRANAAGSRESFGSRDVESNIGGTGSGGVAAGAAFNTPVTTVVPDPRLSLPSMFAARSGGGGSIAMSARSGPPPRPRNPYEGIVPPDTPLIPEFRVDPVYVSAI